MSVLERLTEGIVNRDLEKEGAALLNKWSRTGLLEGLEGERAQSNMARLLENQAKELLREASTMAGGDVEGFAAVAFPIVRRVFGGLIANDLVSVQPMSLPSGLIFFLDFTTSTNGPGLPRLGYGSAYDDGAEQSLYGGGRVASQITGGVSLTGSNAESGFYSLNNGYSSATGSITIAVETIATGNYGGGAGGGWTGPDGTGDHPNYKAMKDSLVRYDPDIASGTMMAIGRFSASALVGNSSINFNTQDLTALYYEPRDDSAATNRVGRPVRRLTRKDPKDENFILLVIEATGSETRMNLGKAMDAVASCSAPISDRFVGSDALGSIRGTDTWGLENNQFIPEIDIKVDSIAVTAITKKLKAKWTPELGQDLNAYHNIDAEVELTGILSEQIALEIDREIMEDLIKLATAGIYYWSRSPGLFVNRTTGLEIGASSAAPDFTGTVSEWYETLIETINDVSAQIHRKTLRGGANFVVCGPEVANVMEFTSGFRASVTADDDRGTIGAVKTGALSRKFDVYVDPYFPRNVVLVGRKGSGFLESGYVYAPYVPLQVTPTIFGTEDFVPRKGVMTRYAKKMVRPDMYGLVIVRGLLGEAGATS